MKNMREELDIITAYNMVGTYRGAADICGTTHKTVKRVVLRHAAGQGRPAKAPRPANYEDVRDLVAQAVKGRPRPGECEAAAAEGTGRGVHRLGAQLPPPCRRGEEDLAGQARPDPPAGVLVPG